MVLSNNKNSASLPKKEINDCAAKILVCALGDSRIIYIQYNDPRFNQVTTEKYSINFSRHNFGAEVAAKWEHHTLSHPKAAVDELLITQSESDTVHEFVKADLVDIFTFKDRMDKLCLEKFILNGEQDEGIKESLERIDETISYSSGCSIS